MLQTINPQTGMVETCREHSPVPRTIYGRGESSWAGGRSWPDVPDVPERVWPAQKRRSGATGTQGRRRQGRSEQYPHLRQNRVPALSKKSKLTTRLDAYGGTWTGRKARGRRRITFSLPAGAVLDGGPRAVVRSLPIAAGGSRPPRRGLRRRPCCSRCHVSPL